MRQNEELSGAVRREWWEVRAVSVSWLGRRECMKDRSGKLLNDGSESMDCLGGIEW